MPGPNALFDFFNNEEEQFLHNGLVEECILIHGIGCYYLPRRTFNISPLFTEDNQKYFDTVYETTFYIENVEGFEGQGNFLSKFGLEIRDQITMSASDTIFFEDVGKIENMQRPNEGDLIYFPLNKKLFQIDFVEKFAMFYPFGATPSYKLTIKLFEYAGEKFDTGIYDIDVIQKTLSENLYDWSVLAEDGSPLMTEDGNYWVLEEFEKSNIDAFDQAVSIQTEADKIMNWDEIDPFSESEF
jgi:hypothetical protein